MILATYGPPKLEYKVNMQTNCIELTLSMSYMLNILLKKSNTSFVISMVCKGEKKTVNIKVVTIAGENEKYSSGSLGLQAI